MQTVVRFNDPEQMVPLAFFSYQNGGKAVNLKPAWWLNRVKLNIFNSRQNMIWLVRCQPTFDFGFSRTIFDRTGKKFG